MPELPEVETIARGLAKRVSGDVIESIWLGQKPEPLKSPAAEIAAVLDVNSNYAGSLLSRASDTFRKEYVKRYGTRS